MQEDRSRDGVRFQVTYVNQNGEKRTTEITASNKIHAASQVAVLGKVLTVKPLSESEDNQD